MGAGGGGGTACRRELLTNGDFDVGVAAITVTPEQQELIDNAVRSGAYSSPDQVIRRALEVLSGEDEWLRAHRQPIHEKIGRGLAQLDRGEGIAGDQAWARLQERKAAWLNENPETAP